MPVKSAKIEIEKKKGEEHEKLEAKYTVARLTTDMISDFMVIFRYLCYGIFAYGLFSILQDVGVMG